MAKQKESVQAKPGQKHRLQAKPVAAVEPVGETLAVTDSETVEGQVSRLDDSRLLTAQRQGLAAQIGQAQGNRHLQRLLDARKSNLPARQHKPPKLGRSSGSLVQRHWIPGEEEAVQTKPLLQRHPAANAISDEAIQRHWIPGEEEEIQTKPLVQRRALTETAPVQPRRVSRSFGASSGWSGQARPNLWGQARRANLIQRQDPVATPDAPTVTEEQVNFDPVTFTPAEVPADGTTTTQASVKTTPGGRNVKWEIVGENYGSTVSGTGLVTPGNDTKDKEKVELTVKATDDKQATAFSTGILTLWDAKLYQAKQDYPKFISSPQSFPNFTIGLNGKFDLEYNPAANLANVIVKVKFDFPESRPSFSNLFGLLGARERTEYRQNFIKQVTNQWSGRYQFKNVREPQSVWGKLNPTTVKVNVLEVDAGQHFTIEVRPKTAGTAQVGGGTAKLFQGDDVPAPQFNPGTGDGELKRVARNTPTPILFENNSAAIPAADQAKLQFLGTYLSRINNPKFNIDIAGHASATGDPAQNQTLSEQRAQAVAAVLTGAGVTQHVITPTGKGQTGADKTPDWRKVEITSSLPVGWQNMQDVTAHEFGHMIGLGDEYAGGGTPTATHYDLVKKAFGQDYADQVAKRGDTDYASIMEGGNDVRIQHYVTFWSALCETTLKAPLPDPKFGYDDWKFIG